MLKDKKVPEQRTTDKDDQISKRVQWSHKKKLQSHKKQARMFKLCALSQVPNLSSPVAIIIITYLF